MMHAEWNAGAAGGYSYHGVRVQDEDSKWFKPNGKKAHGGYVRGYLDYSFNMVNNLNIGVEGFVGYTFRDVENAEPDKKLFSPGVFYGIAAKPKLDFDDTYNLYLILGIHCSHPKIYNFKGETGKSYDLDGGEARHWFINPMIGGGFCYYITSNIGAFFEITYIGLSSGDIKKKKGVLTAKNEALRIGFGMNIKFGE